MGIETLIIFIAMIVVAAIAAGVLLRTQGVLQQRALSVGHEARERLVTGLEIVTVLGYINTTNAQLESIEATVRLKSGSYDVQTKTMGLTFVTQRYSVQSDLLNNETDAYRRDTITFLNGSNRTTAYNYNYDPDDVATSVSIRLAGSIQAGELEIWPSDGRNFSFPLGVNFSNVSDIVNISKLPIRRLYTDNYSEQWGYLTLRGRPSGLFNVNLSAGQNWTDFYIESDVNQCDLNTVPPNYKFCFVVRLGNNNTVVEAGEIFILKMKLSRDKFMTIDDEYTLRLIPKGGALEEVAGRTPQVLSKRVITMWP